MSADFMITILKNNDKLLSKRERLKNKLGGYNPGSKTEYNLPKSTTKHLNKIKKQLIEERKIRMLKVVLLTVFLFSILFVAIMYLLNNYNI